MKHGATYPVPIESLLDEEDFEILLVTAPLYDKCDGACEGLCECDEGSEPCP